MMKVRRIKQVGHLRCLPAEPHRIVSARKHSVSAALQAAAGATEEDQDRDPAPDWIIPIPVQPVSSCSPPTHGDPLTDLKVPGVSLNTPDSMFWSNSHCLSLIVTLCVFSRQVLLWPSRSTAGSCPCCLEVSTGGYRCHWV